MVSSAILVATADRSAAAVDDLALGRHMRSVALLPVLDRPLVAHAVADLVDFGVDRIVVVVDEAVRQPVAGAVAAEPAGSAAVRIVSRDPRRGLAAAVESARRLIADGPFLLRFADCIGRAPMRTQLGGAPIGDHDGVALMSRFDEAAVAAAPPGIVDLRPVTGTFHVGVFALGAGFPTAAGPAEGGSWIDGALEAMESQGGRVERRHVTGWWRHRRGVDAIRAANSFMLADIAEAAVSCEVAESDLEGAISCHPSVKIDNSVIRGPVAIAAGAKIANAFVGPFTSIGRDVRIDGAEIENSVVLEASTICDIGGRIDASVIGPRATIAKDFRIPRGTRFDVGSGATVSF